MYKIIQSDTFFLKLAYIEDYIALDSVRYAHETVNNISKRIDMLYLSPRSGRKVPEFDNDLIRELIYKSYRIIYSIDENSKTITIQTIIHGKQDLNSNYKS